MRVQTVPSTKIVSPFRIPTPFTKPNHPHTVRTHQGTHSHIRDSAPTQTIPHARRAKEEEERGEKSELGRAWENWELEGGHLVAHPSTFSLCEGRHSELRARKRRREGEMEEGGIKPLFFSSFFHFLFLRLIRGESDRVVSPLPPSFELKVFLEQLRRFSSFFPLLPFSKEAFA